MDFELGQNINEEDFEDEFFRALEGWFGEQGFHEDVQVDHGRKVLKDVTFVHDHEGGPEMVWGFSETDIVFYVELPRELFNEPLEAAEGIRLHRLGRSKDGSKRSIVYPLVILELKSNNYNQEKNRCDGTNTHDLNTYSRKMGEWKKLFPRLKCFLVFNVRKVGSIQKSTNKREKILRHVRNFDGVYELGRVVKRERGGEWGIITEWGDGSGEDQLDRLLTGVSGHLNGLEERGYLLK